MEMVDIGGSSGMYIKSDETAFLPVPKRNSYTFKTVPRTHIPQIYVYKINATAQLASALLCLQTYLCWPVHRYINRHQALDLIRLPLTIFTNSHQSLTHILHINHNGRYNPKASRQPMLRLLLQSRRIWQSRLLRMV